MNLYLSEFSSNLSTLAADDNNKVVDIFIILQKQDVLIYRPIILGAMTLISEQMSQRCFSYMPQPFTFIWISTS